MKAKTLRLTRKIQLHIDLPDYEERKEAIAKLYDWQYCCFKASNIIVTHLYVQEMIKEFFYLTEEIQYKLADVKTQVKSLVKAASSIEENPTAIEQLVNTLKAITDGLEND